MRLEVPDEEIRMCDTRAELPKKTLARFFVLFCFPRLTVDTTAHVIGLGRCIIPESRHGYKNKQG